MTTQPPNGPHERPGDGTASRELVGGRYELWGLLGRGGMADVRAGRDLRLGRRVAVKRLRPDLASDPVFQARFRREAQSAASLNHPAIVAVYDTGEETATDGSGLRVPYIVMEYVEGRTLRDILREGRKILPERALEITAGILAALDYSHRAGIVHRDIKPANVMLTPRGDVKVMDFGIARAIADASGTMTQTAAVVGTAQYLSPEQARGETVDSRSDIYSTGCVLYELLTGRPPFVGESPVAVAYQHVREDPAPPSTYEPSLGPELDAICGKALAKSVEDRYQSAAEMRADIERALAGQAVAAPAVVPGADSGPPTLLPVGVTDDTGEPEEEQKSRGWLWALLILALIGLFVLAGLFLPRLLAGEEQQMVTVPRLINMTEDEAQAKLESVDLQLGDTTFKVNPDVKEGLIFEQNPEISAAVEAGSAVDVTISSGRATVTLPNLVDMKLQPAKDLLAENNLNWKVERQPGGDEKDIVVESHPPAGSELRVGDTVTLVVSDGPVQVPDVVGRSEDEARGILEDAGFRVETVQDPSAEAPAGQVTEQTPQAGENAQPNDRVFITVSAKSEPTATATTTVTTTPSPTQTESPSETESPTETGSPGDTETPSASRTSPSPDDEAGVDPADP